MCGEEVGVLVIVPYWVMIEVASPYHVVVFIVNDWVGVLLYVSFKYYFIPRVSAVVVNVENWYFSILAL